MQMLVNQILVTPAVYVWRITMVDTPVTVQKPASLVESAILVILCVLLFLKVDQSFKCTILYSFNCIHLLLFLKILVFQTPVRTLEFAQEVDEQDLIAIAPRLVLMDQRVTLVKEDKAMNNNFKLLFYVNLNYVWQNLSVVFFFKVIKVFW